MEREEDEELPETLAFDQFSGCQCECVPWTASNTRPALAKLVETIDRLGEEPGMLKEEGYRQLMIEVKSVYQALVADEHTVTPGEDSENGEEYDEDDDYGVSAPEFERVMAGTEALFGNSESVSHVTQLVQTMMPSVRASVEEQSETRAFQPATTRVGDTMRAMLERADALRRARDEWQHTGRAPDDELEVRE